MKKLFILFVSAFLLLSGSSAALATSGACSYHGGVDCTAGADYDGSVICADGWKDSSVSLLSSCENELSLMRRIDSIAQVSCLHEFILQNPGGGTGNINSCVEEKRLGLYKIYDPTCKEKMLLSNDGRCFCLGYYSTGVCADTNFIGDVYTKTCGGSLSLNTELDILNKSIDTGGNAFLDIFINVSCGKSVNSMEYAFTPASSASSPTAITGGDWLESQISAQKTIDNTLISRLRGNILLQTQQHGEAWYLHPVKQKRYYLKDGSTAYEMLRSFGLGISENDFSKIENGDLNLKSRLKGRIILRAQAHGDAYYINPKDLSVTYLKNGDAAYQAMRNLSLGISDTDIAKIPIERFVPLK